jgi:hypothetical protein
VGFFYKGKAFVPHFEQGLALVRGQRDGIGLASAPRSRR